MGFNSYSDPIGFTFNIYNPGNCDAGFIFW